MAALSKILRSCEGGRVVFWCPGCDEAHGIRVHGERPGPLWSWDGNVDYPTFSPSILVRGVDMTAKGLADYDAWCAAGHPPGVGAFETRPSVCHSFVRAGKIEFLGDCTHALAGKTVPLPDFPP